MKKVLNINLTPDELSAVELHLQRKNSTLEVEIQKYVEQLYSKIVPQAVKDFIDAKAEQEKAMKKPREKPKP